MYNLGLMAPKDDPLTDTSAENVSGDPLAHHLTIETNKVDSNLRGLVQRMNPVDSGSPSDFGLIRSQSETTVPLPDLVSVRVDAIDKADDIGLVVQQPLS